MTISNFSKLPNFVKIKKSIDKIIVNNFGLIAYIGLVIIVFAIIFLLIDNSDTNEKHIEVRAKELILNGYPELICTADSGNFRVYPKNSYDIIHNDNGYVLWYKNEAMSDGNSFNLNRCEESSIYKK